MRFLLDACVWGTAGESLAGAGHDVDWVGDWPADPGDEEILARAVAEARVLVTLDKDFGERVVVRGEAHRGSGVAAALYEDLFAFGRKIGVTTVTCEFYIEPPNEMSRRFHAKFGFREVSTQWCYGKRVSLQVVTAFQ